MFHMMHRENTVHGNQELKQFLTGRKYQALKTSINFKVLFEKG